MAFVNLPSHRALIRINGPERLRSEKPSYRRRSADEDWLLELFAGIPDLRDAERAVRARGSRALR
jgi:hypothetical protein